MQQQNNSATWIFIAIIAGCVIIGGAIMLRDRFVPESVQAPTESTIDISKVNVAGSPFTGDVNAPVTVAFWSDYQCSFCKKAHQEVITQIIANYADSGKVKIVYKDLAFLGANSTTIALAARAVWEVAPDKFEAWHALMFEKQGNPVGWGSKADVLAATKSLGIDDVQIGQLMDSKAAQYQAALDADKAEGATFGITSTPSFIIGKQRIVGAQSYATFQAAIDTVLAGN